ncbi:MAG: sulfatase-like hydrolase/transferase [Prevotella sp.]|nr:sulfatase-like hydrolase/transferase [Prevotella sp.]
MSNRLRRYLEPGMAVVWNLGLAYVVYMLARVVFLVKNYSYFEQGLTWGHLMEMFGGGLVFDTAAILVTNIPYIVLALLLPWKKPTKWVYIIINSVALAMNLADSVYFRFTMRRTTTTVFSEFQNEQNLGGIIGTEMIHHWYLVLLFGVVVYGIWKLYKEGVRSQESRVRRQETGGWRQVFRWYAAQVVVLAAIAPFVVAGIRGGFTTAVRPITISNANQYVNRPVEAALVLNTPFAIYRTIGKNVFVVPEYFSNPQELEAIYSPIHNGQWTMDNGQLRKNVVVLIVESFGREYIGALNETLEGGKYQGYTPCVDELIKKSVTFKYSYCNGRKSIDGMPSILSSIPMFVEPFILTPASMNEVSGIASLLAGEGYQTAFFHGAQRGSMGFQAFARATGFQEYYGREDYNADKRFGGDDDFDGMWAIWDEPFLQYYATKMSEMKEPFMTAVFTASSHHPYAIPEKYQQQYPEEGLIIHKCIRYTDMAIGKFFEKVSQEPWFKNTIFVLTSDHTNLSDHAYYQTDLGGFCSPIIIYEPGNEERQPEIQDKIAQQIDILPTLMGMLNYPKPYFGFGIDVLNTEKEDTWAVNYLNGIYQYVKHGHVLQFDGEKTKAIYALNDSLMKRNVIKELKDEKIKKLKEEMEQEVKAIVQQYMERMTEDRLKVEEVRGR